MAITIIFAPPRTGKTSFMSYMLNQYAFDRQRNKQMRQEIQQKNRNGFELSIPKHCVSANYNLTFSKFGYSKRHNRLINPFKLGFKNDFVKTHFNYPYEVIGITEAQKYLNSRMAMYFPEWQSRWYEQHGHNHLEILLDTQRPNLIDVNIREISQFIEILNLKISYNKFGKISKMKWTIRKIDNSSLLERYMSSGKKDKSCYKQETVVAHFDVFSIYSSECCKPKFYDGHFEEDFDIQESKTTEESFLGFVKFLDEFDDEMPEGFYQPKTVKKKKDEL